jgi:autotransporter-associated beta strand protein
MNALSNMYSNLGTGKFVIGGDVNGSGSAGATGDGVTVKLPVTTTIIASTLIMDAPESSPKTFTLSLGSGVTTLNVDTLTVGGASTRATNILNFNSGTGSLIIKNKAGSGRAILNVQSSTNSSGSDQISSIDFAGHDVNLSLSDVIVGKRLSLTGTGTGYGSGKLVFDTGVFDASTLSVANKSHNGTKVGSLTGRNYNLSGNLIGLVSFGGGTVNLGTVDLARHAATNLGGSVQGLIEFFGDNTSMVGAVTMANAATALVDSTNTNATGIIHIDSGTVSIASISGASAAANTTATANVNLSGGTLKMGGNITRTGGSGTSAFNLNLSGGTLDMGGNTIGATGSNVTFNWTNGTLKNVSGLNGTAGITVDTSNQSNPVYLDGTNTFTSKITIKDSILQLQSTTALAANSQIGFDGTLGVLKLESGVTLDVSSNLSSGNAQLDTNGNDVIFNSPVVGLTSFTKLGSGKLTLSSSSGSLAPIVTILYGPLELGNGDNQIPSGGFLNGTTSLTLDGSGSSPELIANGVSVDLDAVVNLLNSGATISGTKGTSNYSFNFLKDIIAQDDSAATISATDMITGSNSLFNVGSGAILTISGSFIDGVTATQIAKNGIGTLEFTGTTASTYSGATTVNAGTLAFSQGTLTGSSTAITVNNGANLTAVDLDANVSITVASGGTADISGTDLSVKDIVSENSTSAAFSFSGSSGKITAESLSGSGSTTFGSDLEVDTLNGAGTVDLSGSTPTLTVGAGTFTGTLSSSGTASLVKKGTGTLELTGTNALTGSTTINGGILSVAALSALGVSSDLPENLVIQGGRLQYTGTGETMTRGFTVGDGISGFIANGTGALTISGDMDFADASASNRTLSLGGTSNIAIENIYNPNKISETDVDNLFTKLVKQETNKWIVLGAGAGFVDEAQTEIDIQNGELGFAMGALGSKSTITLGGTGGATATLGWFNDGATTNTDDVSARINLKNNASAAFDIPTGNTVTFGTALSGGTGTSVTKSGGGTLNLDKTNPFSGGFTISGGIVKAGIAGAVGSGTVTVNANSTLVVNAVLANTITIKSNGTLTSDVANQDIDDTTVEQGGILVPGGDAIGTMTVRSLTLKGGSIVNWQISDASGAANNDYSLAGSGYDTFILNSLVLTDISLSKRVIHVKNTTSNGGIASNFDKTAVQTFQFAKLTTALQSQVNVTDLFEIDATEFEYINGLQTDQLVWYMTLSADREYLYVVAVPEPSTYGLGLGALALAFAAVRRRKQKKNPAAV